MNRHFSSATILFVLAVTACTQRSSPPLPPVPVPEAEAPREMSLGSLQLLPGRFLYQLQQTMEVRIDDQPDTLPSSTTTMAAITIHVAAQSDSLFSATVSIDSIDITPSGFIPAAGLRRIDQLDSVIRVDFTPTTASTSIVLPDSLCAYGALVATVRALLVLDLPGQLELRAGNNYSDTTLTQTCRAGVNIDITTIRHLQLVRDSQPPQFEIRQAAELYGAGLTRRDSMTVEGSTITQGAATFSDRDRLPSRVETTSEGRVTVHLGTVRTIFTQQSRQSLTRTSYVPIAP